MRLVRGPRDMPLLLVASAAAVAALMLLPAAYLVVRVAGTGALIDEFTAEPTRSALARTVMLAAAVTASTTLLSLPLAWLTARTDLPMARLWAVLLALPLAIPSYVGAFALVSALGPRGVVQDALGPFGVGWLPEIYGFGGAWFALTIFTYPYVLLPARTALRGLDRSLEESARSLGKSQIATFLRVTLPQLRPALAAGALLVALYTISDFGAVSILRFDSLTRVIYVRYTSSFDRTSAAALALMLVLLSLVIVVVEGATRGRARYHTPVRRGVPSVVTLGVWRWPAFAFCAAVAAISLALPLSIVSYWLARGLAAGEAVEFVRQAAVNSTYASALAGGVAVGAALPIALLSVRRPGAFSGLFEKAVYSGLGLPGISIALALVYFAANYAPAVYQTLGLLVFAYVVRFLPEAVGACRAALLRVNPHTEEAARGLGRGRVHVFARITAPQVLPGMTGGALLVFLTTMKELPATLLLSPIGFSSLATQIWASTSEAFFARAALPALILVGISSVPVILQTWGEEHPT